MQRKTTLRLLLLVAAVLVAAGFLYDLVTQHTVSWPGLAILGICILLLLQTTPRRTP